MITYTREWLNAELIEELDALIRKHYEELRPYEDIALNVDWQKMEMAQARGSFPTYMMRKDGELIGYASFSVGFSVEYKDSLQASMQNIFIHPKNRGYGFKFIMWCDNELKNYGVQVVHHHVKLKSDYGKMLERIGYTKMNIEYSKRLDKE